MFDTSNFLYYVLHTRLCSGIIMPDVIIQSSMKRKERKKAKHFLKYSLETAAILGSANTLPQGYF